MTIIQIRDVDEATADALKARAAEKGTSLSEYLRGELDRIAARANREALFEAMARNSVSGLPDIVDVLDAERAERP